MPFFEIRANGCRRGKPGQRTSGRQEVIMARTKAASSSDKKL